MHHRGGVFVLECTREAASMPLPPGPRLDPTTSEEDAVKEVTGSTNRNGLWTVKRRRNERPSF